MNFIPRMRLSLIFHQKKGVASYRVIETLRRHKGLLCPMFYLPILPSPVFQYIIVKISIIRSHLQVRKSLCVFPAILGRYTVQSPTFNDICQILLRLHHKACLALNYQCKKWDWTFSIIRKDKFSGWSDSRESTLKSILYTRSTTWKLHTPKSGWN